MELVALITVGLLLWMIIKFITSKPEKYFVILRKGQCFIYPLNGLDNYSQAHMFHANVKAVGEVRFYLCQINLDDGLHIKELCLDLDVFSTKPIVNAVMRLCCAALYLAKALTYYALLLPNLV